MLWSVSVKVLSASIAEATFATNPPALALPTMQMGLGQTAAALLNQQSHVKLQCPGAHTSLTVAL